MADCFLFLMETTSWLVSNCCIKNAFYSDQSQLLVEPSSFVWPKKNLEHSPKPF